MVRLRSRADEWSVDSGIRTHESGLTVYGREIPEQLDCDAGRMRGHAEWLSEGIRRNLGPLQEFLNGYYETDSHRDEELTRFALSIELVDRLCPHGGRWFDAGSYGHDALRVGEVRPDIRSVLVSYEGGVIMKEPDGLLFWEGKPPGPAGSVNVERSDLERNRWKAGDHELDLVTAFEVIEHFKRTPLAFVLEANRTLKPGAKVLLSTPNCGSARAASNIARGLHPSLCPVYHRRDDYGRVHPLEYDRAQLVDLLTLHGFELDLLCSVNLSPFDAWERWAIRVIRRLRVEHEMAEPMEVGQRWFAIATKVQDVRVRSYPPSLFA
jgi:SAM-dependent methyltransferase